MNCKNQIPVIDVAFGRILFAEAIDFLVRTRDSFFWGKAVPFFVSWRAYSHKLQKVISREVR